MVGMARKLERERENPPCLSPAPSLFFALFFSIHAFPTISEPGTGYSGCRHVSPCQTALLRTPLAYKNAAFLQRDALEKKQCETFPTFFRQLLSEE